VSSNRARVGILGCGRVSARYLEVFRDELTDVATVVAVADKISGKREQLAGALEAEAVGGIDDLIKAKPDIVCILTESGNHAEHALELLRAGINIIVEKPIALRISDAERLGEEAEKRGLICAEIKQNRFNPALQFLRGAVDDGRFGRMVTAGVRVHWCREQSYYNDEWHGRWSMDGGVLSQQAIHHLDALRWLGGPIEAVCASGQAVLNKLEAEDTAVAVVRFESGALGTIEATTSARPRDFEASLHLVGEKALAKVGGLAMNLVETWAPVKPEVDDAGVIERYSQEVPTGYGLSHGPYIRDVLQCLADGRNDVAVGVEEGLKTLRVLHAIYASMESGGWVQLSDGPVSSRLGVRG
jgi:UDP-N-acetyl-2-amino-2-deoxyglucuronate dehydrogenase